MFDDSWMKCRILRGCGQRVSAWLFLLVVLCAVGSPVFARAGGSPEKARTDAPDDVGRSFAMAFPVDFTVSTDAKQLAAKSYFPLDDGSMRLGGCYSGEEYAGTNFGSACITVSVSPDEGRDGDCARFDGDTLCGEEGGVRDAVVNGLRLRRADMSDAAMGHRLEARDYWIVHDGRRYDIRLFVGYTAMEMYTPGEKREFSLEDCWARLTGVLNTFSFR
ncbi:hypothetical protein BerOc1_03544 [Pseudodesulfovibrio hydrargyri]|uniref:Uncharacterized protein n=1 Tax=Pseudodesulfovibrio hydrargyri TaxID=2125990 RepID=A0A1J5N637_9BACT|nr:hypothetical protein [Pseudodesulfovibrio hydrargyri]OIQ48791.1 hypothetical protein BerOc1_03544 [Pseudodesulfovibrio hydrargyri]